MFKDHEKIFGQGKWMWADFAYTPKMWSVALFKKPVNGQLTADQRTYSYWVSKVSYVLSSKLNELHYLQILRHCQQRKSHLQLANMWQPCLTWQSA